jgi:predicted metal-dependent phosphoesterase TrpH
MRMAWSNSAASLGWLHTRSPRSYSHTQLVASNYETSQGMEVYSPAQKGAVGRKYKEMAQRFGLVGTGGSDFHTENGTYPPGCMKMPYTVVQALRERREKSRAEWF